MRVKQEFLIVIQAEVALTSAILVLFGDDYFKHGSKTS